MVLVIDWLLSGWLGLAGLIVVGCAVAAYIFPPFRRIAIEIAAVVFAAAAIYAKGNRDRSALENRRKEEAVQKAQKDYANIDARSDDPKSVAKRLRDGSF